MPLTNDNPLRDTEENALAYIGRCRKCRAIVYAGVDGCDLGGLAEEIADLVRDGLIIETRTVRYVRRNAFKQWGCKCPEAPE